MKSISDLFAEWVRFGFVGLAATLTYLIASLLADGAGAQPFAANLVGYLASVFVSYFGHALVTFRIVPRHSFHGPRFAAISLATFALTNAIVFAVVEVLELSFPIAALSIALAIPVFTWAVSRWWVFKNPD